MTLVYDAREADELSKSDYMEALKAEGCRISGPYAPVYANPLLNLYAATSPVPYRDPSRIQKYRELKLPGVEQAVNETALVLPHAALLADRPYMDQWLDGVRKVNDNAKAVRAFLEERRAGGNDA